MSIASKIQNLIDAGNEVTGYSDTNITDVVQALIDGYGGETPIKYSHYMSHITPWDGFYNSHSYDAVFVKNGFLYVFYKQAPHHYTDYMDDEKTDTAMRVLKYNISTKSVVSIKDVLRPAEGIFHGVEVNGTYYLFTNNTNYIRVTTTDFDTFTQGTYTGPKVNYLTKGDNNRIICTTETTSKGCNIYYSDDLGLTWTKATGYSDAVTSHGAIAKVGDKIVCYCQDKQATMNMELHDVKRMVLISEDNGETWTGSECLDSDLVDCGRSYSTGSFCQIGDDWYFATNRRTIEQKADGYMHVGDVRLFKGTEQDVINGTMKLFKVIDDFNTQCTSVFNPTLTQSDSGNMGMRTDGESLFIVYHRQFLHSDPQTTFNESNSMICLAIVNATRGVSMTDSYYDSDWETERDTFVSSEGTDYDLYAYGSSKTNISDGLLFHSDYSVIPTTDFVVANKLVIPFVSSFEIKAVIYMRTIYDSSNEIMPIYIGSNTGGNIDVFGNLGSNCYYFNRTDPGNGIGLLGGATGINWFHLKYSNGQIDVTLNGRTINNLLCHSLYDMRGSESIAYNTIEINMGDMATYLDNYTSVNARRGILAMAINTDGDVSSLTS